MQKKRLGAIRWDANGDSHGLFPGFSALALSPAKYHSRVPYFAKYNADGSVSYPPYTLQTFEEEMKYAKEAGIDYFAYCWYSKKPVQELSLLVHDPKRRAVADHVQELAEARQFHKLSAYRNDVHLCAIICAFPFLDEDFDDLCKEMKEDYYEKIDGHPLVYVFLPSVTESDRTMLQFRQALKRHQVPEPHWVQFSAGDTAGILSCANTTSQYSSGFYGAPETGSFAEHITVAMRENIHRATLGKKLIPSFSFGWNPEPRIDCIVPWTGDTYPHVKYAAAPSEADILAEAHLLRAFAEENKDICLNHYLLFAWDEYEEGGYVCPTWTVDENGVPVTDAEGNIIRNTKHLAILKKAADILKR